MFSWLLFLWLLTAYWSFYKIILSSLVEEQDPGASSWYHSCFSSFNFGDHTVLFEPQIHMRAILCLRIFRFFFLFFLHSSKAKFNAIRCLNYFFQWEMFFSYLIKLKMWLLRYTFFKWGPQFNFLPCLVPKLCLFTSASDPWSVLGFNIALVIHVFSVVLLCNHGLYFCDICTMHLTV